MAFFEIAARELRQGDRVEHAVVDSLAYSESSFIAGFEGLKAALVVTLAGGRIVELYPSWQVRVDRQIYAARTPQTPTTVQLVPL